jgi:exosortase A-associated hydrolase 1
MSAPASGRERPVVFPCGEDQLLGMLHPAGTGSSGARGVLIVVGGPQYRVGSHRQFVLLARDLAAAGHPVLRFDYRGMGDSEGPFRGFEAIGDDIGAALDAFQAEQPEVHEIVLWGLCDAASAAAFHGHRDRRVSGMVLLNPWVRTEAGEARTVVRHYYRARLRDPAFWRKLLSLRFNPMRALSGLLANLRRSRGGHGGPHGAADEDLPLPERMRRGLAAFRGHVLLLLSGNDLTAREFEDTAHASAQWRQWMESSSVRVARLPEADHTFSRAEWRERVSVLTRDWLEAS